MQEQKGKEFIQLVSKGSYTKASRIIKEEMKRRFSEQPRIQKYLRDTNRYNKLGEQYRKIAEFASKG